eukprot:s2725_g1.t1
MQFEDEPAKNYMLEDVLTMDFDMDGEMAAEQVSKYDLNIPKSIFEDDVTMNGSCIFLVNCGYEMDWHLHGDGCVDDGSGISACDIQELYDQTCGFGGALCICDYNMVYDLVVLTSYDLIGPCWNHDLPALHALHHGEQAGEVEVKEPLGPMQEEEKGNPRTRWQCHLRLRGLIFMALYLEVGGMDAQQATDMLTRIKDLSQAETQAGNTASNLMNEFQSGQGKGGSRFGDGAKILRTPDVFEVDDPVKYTLWREQFINWITFCDPKYGDLIRDVEALDIVEPLGALEPNIRELGIKLYSILSSYLRGPALQVVRSCSNDRNGFAVWHKLKSLYAPRARPRALAIGQAIMQHPAFGGQKSMLENLLQFDSLLDQYELASGQKMPDDLTVSTILRCIDAPTRRHLEMVMDETYTYGKLKEKLILLDKNTKSWSGDGFLKSLQAIQNPSTSSTTASQGPVPMEVDQVSYGHKGKGKNKGKSGKGKKGERSKWCSTRASNIRRVKLYNVATPPLSGPEIYELDSNADVDEWYSACMVRLDYEVFNMAAGDEADGGEEWKQDPLYVWYGNICHDFDKVKCSADDDVDWYHVRAVPLQDAQLIVLDSGADISLLPQSMCEKGTSRKLGRTVLQDAQGSRLETYGKRSAQLECEGCNDDLVVIEDDFIVASVQSPLISLGRLLHKGWSLQPSSSAEAGVNLVTPDRCCEVPLCFKKNSLALHAHIRMVNMVEEDVPTSFPLTSIEEQDEPMDEEDDEEMLVIQTIMEPNRELLARIFRRGWGHACQHNVSGSKFAVVEHCVLYSTKENIAGEIEECKGKPTMVMTILHSKEEPLDDFGEVSGENVVPAGGRTLDASSFMFATEPSVPQELQEGLKPEELEQLDQDRGLFKELEKFEWTFENKDSLMVVVGSTMIKKDSSIALMRAGAEYLGISKSGSKETLWTRLNQSVQKFEHQRLFQDANKLYREEMEIKGIKPQAQPRAPSDQERMLHEHTHLPFRPWCDFCVSCKSKMDAQRPVDDAPEGRREGPSMQIDYCYGKIAPGDPAITVLVGLDCQTKMLTAMPVETKGSNLRGQAEHLTRFSLMMNHLDKLELVADSEPTMLSLCQSVSLMRQHLGFETVISHGRPGDKGRTAQVERAIQTLRRQASTLLHMAEQKCELRLPGTHALVPWSYIHAAWLLNRFHNHSTIKTSPFQLAFGRSYAGRVACFGETVMVLHRRGLNCKAGPQWVPGIWLGKSEQEDLHVVAAPEGILRGKAIRRTAEPWRGVWLFMVNQKPQHDYDAKDVIDYARKHPEDSDHDDDVDDVEIDETADLKREKSEGSFMPRKSARLEDESSGHHGLHDDVLPGEDPLDDEVIDEGKPPELPADELEKLDIQAGFTEIERLLKMGVLKEPTEDDLSQGTILTTRMVFDWRFRENGWLRRGRYVAREFKGNDRGSSETFAPTSGIGSRLVLLLYICLRWFLSFMDVKDAFLLVPQQEKVLVEKPVWYAGEGHTQYWTLSKCLPGQRNAAARFFSFLCDHLSSLGFSSSPLLPSLFRHSERDLVLCSHVDDLIVCGSQGDVAWLVNELEQRFTLSGGGLVPAADQDPKEPVRFLKKRHFFTGAGVVISPLEKYIEGLVKAHKMENRKPKATPDIALDCLDGDELDDVDKHTFRSSMGTLLYLSQDRVDIQHAVRNLSQWMSRPTRPALDGVRHLVLYLKGTPTYGVFLPYTVASNSKLEEIHGKSSSCFDGERVEVFTDSDWAGLYIGRLWEFLVRKDVSIAVVIDSSSGKAFAQRLGVGRMKHIDVKFLWLQRCVKEQLLAMESVGTLFNVADLGTKKLNKVRRLFLMFLMNIVEFNDELDCYVPVGEDEYNDHMQKKMIGQNMKAVRQVMAQTIAGGMENFKPKISTSMVRAMTLLAMQPMVKGVKLDELKLEALLVKSYIEIFMENTYFLRRVVEYVDDWDPVRCELRHFRILSSAEDAWSGEEYFRETPKGLAKYVRPDRKRRFKYDMREVDPLEAYQMTSDESAEEEAPEHDTPMEVDEVANPEEPPQNDHGDGEHDSNVTAEPVELPGSPSHSSQGDPGPLPIVGTDWEDIETILRHFPARQAERADRVREVALFEQHMFKEYCKVHLMTLFPQQPDMMWDYAGWWTRSERHGYSVFQDIVIRGQYLENFGSFCEQWFIHQDYEYSTHGSND